MINMAGRVQAPDARSAAQWHAAEAERLLGEAGKSIFQGTHPMHSTREECLAAAQVHATLALYYRASGQEATNG